MVNEVYRSAEGACIAPAVADQAPDEHAFFEERGVPPSTNISVGQRDQVAKASALNLDTAKIAVIGLGYVGLPLAVEFGKKRPVIGFDIRRERIDALKRDYDATLEVETDDLMSATHLDLTGRAEELKDCGIFIVAVPTPIDRANRPDLSPLRLATQTVGWAMSEGAVVIYESTVYPGCTRDFCVPILEQESGLRLNEGFFVGYSPERANPGDKVHRLTSITKVTSGSTPEATDAIDRLYGSIVTSGTHKTSSIEVAEAAKIIENTQRDLNIALMNELAIIFHKIGIDTPEVVAAASTKWNFLPFKPGLVGGHCIGVDPYYLTHCAQLAGYHPEVILAGRRINDGMGAHVADRVARLMMQRGFPVVGSRILVLGLTFKENCPDLRNSKVLDLIRGLRNYNAEVDVHDACADPTESEHCYGTKLLSEIPAQGAYDAIVVAVPHNAYGQMGAERIRALSKPGAILFDVKGLFARNESDGRL